VPDIAGCIPDHLFHVSCWRGGLLKHGFHSSLSPSVSLGANLYPQESLLRFFYYKKILARYNGLAVFDKDFHYFHPVFRLDLVHDFHRFDDAQGF